MEIPSRALNFRRWVRTTSAALARAGWEKPVRTAITIRLNTPRILDPMKRLLEIMKTLRGPDGCPWDREQTHLSLRPFLLEEAAEAVDALSSGNVQDIPDELGDVLLQVAFHAVIAEETGDFDYSDIENAICEKLIRRHPHIFGLVTVSGADEVVQNWNEIKKLERGGKEKHPLERIPAALGALERERQTQKALEVPKLEKSGVLEAVQNASSDAQGVQDVLGAAVAWARSLGVNAELELREKTTLNIKQELERA